jgi:hypothetical protein
MKPYGWVEAQAYKRVRYPDLSDLRAVGAPTRHAALASGTRRRARREQAKAARRAVPGLVLAQLEADAE